MNTATNNIVVNAVKAGFDYLGDCDGGGASLFANNLLFGNAGGDFNWAPGSSSACDTVQGTLHEDPNTTFVGYASGDFHLKAGSIAIGHGTAACTPGQTSCVPTVDIDGVARARRQGVPSTSARTSTGSFRCTLRVAATARGFPSPSRCTAPTSGSRRWCTRPAADPR